MQNGEILVWIYMGVRERELDKTNKKTGVIPKGVW